MKNKFILIVLSLVTVLPVAARERSQEEMTALAAQVLQANSASGIHKVSAMQKGSTTPIRLMKRHEQFSVMGYDEGGFAVIGHDDALPAVLAYCEGRYDEAVSNPSFRHYMDTFNAYLQSCAESGEAPRFIQKAATLGNPDGVKPLMLCKWDQGEPYNDMAPTLYKNDEDRRSATGCVATAMAQIIYTLNKQLGTPIRPRGVKRYFYLNGAQRSAYEQANLSSLTFDWRNMLATYDMSSNPSYSRRMAVARLMYACGVVSEMYYAPGNSGTYINIATSGVNTHFEGVRSEYTGYGLGGWEQRIYDELDAKHPILITGNNGQGNHAFAADGYDSEGRLHLNMGWSGGGNGYYTIANMDGFSSGQAASFFIPTDEALVHLSDAKPLEELRGKYATADIFHPATSVEEGRWYVLYNCRYYSAAYSSGAGLTMKNSAYVTAGDPTEQTASMLVRFQAKKGAKDTYYIQTGTGDYLGALSSSGNSGTTATATEAYTIGNLYTKAPKYFYLKQNGGVLTSPTVGDKNGLYAPTTTTPVDTMGASCWLLLPVRVGDNAEDMNPDLDRFSPTKRYTLSAYNDGTAVPLNYKLTIQLTTAAEASEVRIVPASDGWHVTSLDGANILGAKSSPFKIGNGSSNTDTPLTLYFEPTDEPVNTSDPDLNATSRIYRIRCEAGYLGSDKVGNNAYVYCNKMPHASYLRWLVTDKTAYDERTLPEGVSHVSAGREINAGQVYDLEGKALNPNKKTPNPLKGGLQIQNGRKVLAK